MTWIITIARHRALDIVRKGIDPLPEEEQGADSAADAPIHFSRQEMTDELKRLLECVGQLDPSRQKLVLMAYYNGWSREQLAEKFGETPFVVKNWLRDGLLDIRPCLGLS
jgi:RNA polymerase sigma-70 factor, ECF subfamily